MTYATPVIYKLDSKGKTRRWQGFAENNTWYSESGLIDGKQVSSTPKIVKATNVGRANERSEIDQAIFEVNAEMDKKLERGYFIDIGAIGKFEKFKPMLANDYTKLKKPVEFPVYSQPKLDGIRCVFKEGKLWSRAGKEIVSCPHIADSLAFLYKVDPSVIIDGELYNHELKDNFNEITSIVRKTKPEEEDFVKAKEMIQYHIYDMYSSEVQEAKFADRFGYIGHIVTDDELDNVDYIISVNTDLVNNQEQLDKIYSSYLENGYEGQIVRLNEKYENKRSKYLLKRKEFLTDEFEVLSVEEGLGNWGGAIKRFHLKNEDGTTFSAGVRGSYDNMKALYESGDKPNWATLRYFTPTPDGVPRFPVVIDYGFGVRDD